MMTAICDGCGKEAPAIFNGSYWIKPTGWYQRDVAASRICYGGIDDSGAWKAPTVIMICSLGCASLVADKFKEFIKL